MTLTLKEAATEFEGDETFCDRMFDFMSKDKNILDKTEIDKVKKFMIEEQFESDTIKEDVDIYGNHNQSNFYMKFRGNTDLKLFLSMKQFLTHYKCYVDHLRYI